MINKLGTILVVGDAPRAMGQHMVCKLLEAGYKVKAPDTYADKMDEEFVGALSQIDFLEFNINVTEDDNGNSINGSLVGKLSNNTFN